MSMKLLNKIAELHIKMASKKDDDSDLDPSNRSVLPKLPKAPSKPSEDPSDGPAHDGESEVAQMSKIKNSKKSKKFSSIIE